MADKSQIVKPIIRVIIALISLGVINFIIGRLPGINVQIPGLNLPWSNPTIITAVIYTIMIVIILKFGFTIGPTIQNVFPKFSELRTIAMNVVYLIALGIAYGAYRPIVTPFLSEDIWLYDLGFLVVGLILAYIVASTLMKSTDKWTDHIFNNVKQATGEFIVCTKCGWNNEPSNKFCNKCGSHLEQG